MELFFEGDILEFQDGIDQLMQQWAFSQSKDGVPIKVEQTDVDEIYVNFNHSKAEIHYHHPVQFFRALGLLLEHMQVVEEMKVREVPQFQMNGPMLDCSRNAVLTTEFLKEMIRLMAGMGLNTLLLYMEDTYEIESAPYFGYMRGRYSREELKEIDEFASLFGIEVIPCIQTLAHLSTYLRWDVTKDIRDTDDILLANSEKTYQFIEKMIQSVSEPFRSRRIHIGMDEAHFLGRGNYIERFGHQSAFQIMSDHLQAVREITAKHHLQPMIWSDMYFRIASDKGDYYDTQAAIPKDIIRQKPDDVQLVYWDYYHEDQDFYHDYIRKHQEFGMNPLFAGGIWTFNGNTIHYDKTFASTHAALRACKKEGVTEVFVTLWGDDGAETNPFTALLGLQLYAEHGYTKEITNEKLRSRFRFCTGAEMDAFLQLGSIDSYIHPGKNLEPVNPSKFLLWQDPLVGLFDHYIEDQKVASCYQQLEKDLLQVKTKTGKWQGLFDYAGALCATLSIKSTIGTNMKTAYEQNDKAGLDQILQKDLPELLQKVKRLHLLHYKQWMETNKPFGWEVLDIRYGGLMLRIETTMLRLREFLEGTITAIPELEQERLSYANEAKENELVRCNLYQHIATPNVL
ncbi:beta-N-acetylhexosaminidase [Gracilibacillus caseinilyticus]|uniref:Beta-N-acetylhexosaminidase n=1 Tax=Gracilibacillus caseinilyticus TaxID=2932256 RepID=A0ABY4ETA1_9BACI|nr:beta-N-acetylhexosaminidase [Gracilibacillus caseinilyticus]UOQ47648.1 beta-N-acetylhexosaminidase [Gracilibacillus caseinilyticus]